METTESRTTSPALIPPSLRWLVLGVAGGCALVVVILGLAYGRTSTPSAFDSAVQAWLQEQVPDNHVLMWFAAGLAGPRVLLAAVAIVASAAYLCRRWSLLLLAVLGPGAAMLVTQLLKPLIGRTISGAWAMPSGHTTALVALLTVAALTWINRRGALSTITDALVLCGLVVALTAMLVALVRQQWHYATDIIAGGCVAFAAVACVAVALDCLSG